MKNRRYKLWMMMLTIALILPLVSCGKEQPSQNNTIEKIQTQKDPSITYNPQDAQIAAMDFSVRLFQNSVNPPYENGKVADDNVLISPTSVLTALAMTANGAENDTLAQMEEVFGMTRESLNDYMRVYLDNLSKAKKHI